MNSKDLKIFSEKYRLFILFILQLPNRQIHRSFLNHKRCQQFPFQWPYRSSIDHNGVRQKKRHLLENGWKEENTDSEEEEDSQESDDEETS